MAEEKYTEPKAADTAEQETEACCCEAETPAAETEKTASAQTEADSAADGGAPECEAASGENAETGENTGEAEAKPDKKDQKIDELTDKYKRLFAEFDNFRKRTDAEKAGMYAEGERGVLLKILPIVDNFERAVQNVPEELQGSSYVDGVEKIYRSCIDTLKALGVEPIEAAGKEFDASLHNAVMHVEDEGVGENIVVEEFQKGYMFRDKVLRYSMVKVAN